MARVDYGSPQCCSLRRLSFIGRTILTSNRNWDAEEQPVCAAQEGAGQGGEASKGSSSHQIAANAAAGEPGAHAGVCARAAGAVETRASQFATRSRDAAKTRGTGSGGPEASHATGRGAGTRGRKWSLQSRSVPETQTGEQAKLTTAWRHTSAACTAGKTAAAAPLFCRTSNLRIRFRHVYLSNASR